MDSLIQFASTASPLAILAIAVGGLVYVLIKTYKGENKIDKISDVQDEKYPILLDHVERFNQFDQRFNALDAKLEKIANNHLHELPDMMKSIGRIENKVDRIEQKQISQGEDIAVLKDFKSNIKR
jgi:hypothetical protein